MADISRRGLEKYTSMTKEFFSQFNTLFTQLLSNKFHNIGKQFILIRIETSLGPPDLFAIIAA